MLRKKTGGSPYPLSPLMIKSWNHDVEIRILTLSGFFCEFRKGKNKWQRLLQNGASLCLNFANIYSLFSVYAPKELCHRIRWWYLLTNAAFKMLLPVWMGSQYLIHTQTETKDCGWTWQHQLETFLYFYNFTNPVNYCTGDINLNSLC